MVYELEIAESLSLIAEELKKIRVELKTANEYREQMVMWLSDVPRAIDKSKAVFAEAIKRA